METKADGKAESKIDSTMNLPWCNSSVYAGRLFAVVYKALSEIHKRVAKGTVHVICEYVGRKEPLDRVNRLRMWIQQVKSKQVALPVGMCREPSYYTTGQKFVLNELGDALTNVDDAAVQLSKLYCIAFDCTLPMHERKQRNWETTMCSGCDARVYAKEFKRKASRGRQWCAKCTNRYWAAAPTEHPTNGVPRATLAFHTMKKDDPTALLVFARDIWTDLKEVL